MDEVILIVCQAINGVFDAYKHDTGPSYRAMGEGAASALKQRHFTKREVQYLVDHAQLSDYLGTDHRTGKKILSTQENHIRLALAHWD